MVQVMGTNGSSRDPKEAQVGVEGSGTESWEQRVCMFSIGKPTLW